jgi:hypothetical protein
MLGGLPSILGSASPRFMSIIDGLLSVDLHHEILDGLSLAMNSGVYPRDGIPPDIQNTAMFYVMANRLDRILIFLLFGVNPIIRFKVLDSVYLAVTSAKRLFLFLLYLEETLMLEMLALVT